MTRMSLIAAVVLWTCVHVQGATDAFPPADPASVGVPSAAIDAMRDVVKGFVDRGEVVGAEVLVIKDGKTIWNEGFGLRDRDRKEAMVPGTIFCIRSMTKPVVGTAAQMLIDDGKLKLDDPVSKYLTSFDNDKCRAITVGQLLTHTSGLPLSLLVGRDIKAIKSVREVADLSGADGPEFPPGEGFHYSDQGPDTLTAVIEVVGGMPADMFVNQRVCKPLDMKDSACVLPKGDERNAKAASAYLGGTGAWTRFSDVKSDGGLFPVFLGSQAMYSTPENYARVLALWMDKGLVGTTRLLSDDAIARGLSPANEQNGLPTSLTGLKSFYGQMWMVYPDASGKVVAFGHHGSDGTYSWAFPERDLMVLYFTQSRGETTGLRFEEAMQRILLDGDTAWRPASTAVDVQAASGLVGVYDAGPAKGYRGILVRNGRVLLEVPGRACAALVPGKSADEWTIEQGPGLRLVFERDAAGMVTALVGWRGEKSERMPRYKTQDGLPTSRQVAEMVTRAHGSESMKSWGAFRVKSHIKVRGQEGTSTLLVKDSTHIRVDVEVAGHNETTVINGDKGWKEVTGMGMMDLDAGTTEHTRLSVMSNLLADWTEQFKEVRVLRHIEEEGLDGYSVRCVSEFAYPSLRLVDRATGELREMDSIIDVPGLGAVGFHSKLEDYREIDGVRVPFRLVAEFATPILGTIETRVDSYETHVEAPDSLFEPPPNAETKGGDSR